MAWIEVIRAYDETVYQGILNIRARSFPQGWAYEDEREYFFEALHNPENIHIVLRDETGFVGYLLAVPHNGVADDEEVQVADPLMHRDSDRYYVETAAIVPELRGSVTTSKYFFEMLHVLIREAGTRFRVNKFSLHARVKTGLSRAVCRYFRQEVTMVRRVDKWKFYNHEEPADYLELTITHS